MLANSTKGASEVNKEHRVELGHWLKMLRQDAGLSQRDLASILGLEYYTFISQLENGRGRIPPSRYKDWAEALGQDIKPFVVKLLSYYDPITYEILYEDRAG